MIAEAIAARCPNCGGQVRRTSPSDQPKHCSRACANIARGKLAPKVKEPFLDRFWRQVQKSDGCWIWAGALSSTGYGVIGVQHPVKRNLYAHRVSYELHIGPVPDGYFVCHRCDNPRCVRPDHLFVGTHRDNMADMVAKGRSNAGDKHPSRRYPERRARGDNHGLRKHPERVSRGEVHAYAKLTVDAVRAIRAEYSVGGISQRELAERYGVTQTVIGDAIRRKSWAHVQ